MRLTYQTAIQYAVHRAKVDVGEHWWDQITLAEQNARVARHLERLWAIIDDAHRTRLEVGRAERRRAS